MKNINVSQTDIPMLCASDIKDRGWTDKMLKEYLPEPDQTETNPHYKCAAPMKLYHIEKVIKIEETKQFQESKNKSEKRRQGSKKGVETKRKKLLEYIDSIEITVPQIEIEELEKRAINHYNDRQCDMGNYDNSVGDDADQYFLNRIVENYVRHNLTQYEQELIEIYGKIGKGEAYCLLKKKVLNKIAEIYPSL